MGKFLGLLAVGGMLAAAPALADVVYTPLDVSGDTNVVGIYRPGYSGLYDAYVTSGQGVQTSDLIQFTFGFHIGYGAFNAYSFYDVWGIQFAFAYDNTSLEVVGARSVGPISAGATGQSGGIGRDNYSDLTPLNWPNPSSGITSLPSLFQGWYGLGYRHVIGATPTDYWRVFTTSIVPFFQVTLHVKHAEPSAVNSFWVTSMFVASTITGYTITPGQWIYGHGAVHEIPEPSSLLLVGGGVAFGGARVVRRRRRAT
jgi:hypothetical protein